MRTLTGFPVGDRPADTRNRGLHAFIFHVFLFMRTGLISHMNYPDYEHEGL